MAESKDIAEKERRGGSRICITNNTSANINNMRFVRR